MKGLDTAKQCLRIICDKKAQDPVILDLKGLTDIADYFVICSGTSSRHLKTIASSIREGLTKRGVSALHYEVDTEYNWVVLDYIDVIVHIFNEDTRSYYRLEQLWGDAKRIEHGRKG